MTTKELAWRMAMDIEEMFSNEMENDLEYLYDMVTTPKFIEELIERNED